MPVPKMIFRSIKAINKPTSDEDSWNFKGTLTGLGAGIPYLDIMRLHGAEVDLSLPVPGNPSAPRVYLDTVFFEGAGCKAIRQNTSISCRTDGAPSSRSFAPVPKNFRRTRVGLIPVCTS